MNEYPRLGNGKDYGIVSPPTDASVCLEFLARKITGSVPYTTIPESPEQYNTELTEYILNYVRTNLSCTRDCPIRHKADNLKVHDGDYL